MYKIFAISELSGSNEKIFLTCLHLLFLCQLYCINNFKNLTNLIKAFQDIIIKRESIIRLKYLITYILLKDQL